MEVKTLEVVGQVSQGQFRLGPGRVDGADEQAKPVLLMGENVLDMGADRGLRRIGPRRRIRYRLAPEDPTGQHPVAEPLLVASCTVGTVGPDLTAGIVGADDLFGQPSVRR